MTNQRTVITKKLCEFDAAPYFKRLTGVEPSNVPQKYGTAVSEAQKALEERGHIVIAFMRADITGLTDASVTLLPGVELTGEMPAKVLAESQQAVCYVIALTGFDEVKPDDMLVEYFVDAWGSAFVEAAQAWLAGQVQAELEAEGKKRTHLWCPGQHRFDLINQKALFYILRPEEFGCTLTKHYMMVPVKSASGIIGVVDKACSNLPKPCDYCKFKPTCPASDGGCSAL